MVHWRCSYALVGPSKDALSYQVLIVRFFNIIFLLSINKLFVFYMLKINILNILKKFLSEYLFV